MYSVHGSGCLNCCLSVEAVACSAAGAPVPENIDGNPVLRVDAVASIAVFIGDPPSSRGLPSKVAGTVPSVRRGSKDRG